VESMRFRPTHVLRHEGSLRLHGACTIQYPPSHRSAARSAAALAHAAASRRLKSQATLTNKSLKWEEPEDDGLEESSLAELRGRRGSGVGFEEGRRISLRRRRPLSAERRNHFALFISYYRDEAGPHARLLHGVFEKVVRAPVYLEYAAGPRTRVVSQMPPSSRLCVRSGMPGQFD